MMKKMKINQIMPEINKDNKFSRTLNINKKQYIKYKSKSNNKLDIKLTKPVKIKMYNKLKTNIKKNSKNNQIKNKTKEKDNEKEKEVSLDYYYDKELIQPIKTNKNIDINNKINTLENNYIKINNKTPKKLIKKIKTQLISKDIKTTNNIGNYNYHPLINGGNVKNIHGKLNLNITLNNKSPVRLRKINMNKKYSYNVDCLSTYKKEKQINTIYVNNNKNMNMDLNMNIFNNDLTNINNTTINNEESTIIKLQKEIENQKRENLYKEMLINDMKKQLDDINKHKNISNDHVNSSINNDILLLKQELDLLNNKINNDINDINYNSINNYKNINKEESILFDKLKNNYSNNKNLINELINENESIQKKINDINIINGNKNKSFSYIINEKKNNISFNYIPKENSIKINNFIFNNCNSFNNFNEEINDNIISNYVENILKSSNKDFFINNKYNKINDEQKNLIKLMIKMTLNSNYIPEDEIISLFMNNLLNFQNSIDSSSIQYMKTNNYLDKEMIQNYFKLISIDDKNSFNINNIFIEIISFYDKDIKQLNKIKIEEFFSQRNNKLSQVLKECKLVDNLNTGLIEINQFKNILNKYQFYKDFNEDANKIFNILLYNMKKNINIEQIGLFQLSYNNLGNDLGLELNDSFNNSSENNSLILEKNEKEKKISLFGKNIEKNEDKIIRKKITSNVDFKPDKNEKERGSGNSNNTYGLLSSNKFSFDYSSKSGSKDPDYLKEGIKELASEFNETEEYLTIFCKEYVDNLFKTIMEDIQRKKINVYRMSI